MADWGALVLPWLAVAAGFRWVYAVLAAFCAVSVWLTWRWLHEPPHADVAAAGRRHAHSDAGPLRSVGVWRIAAAIGLLCAPQFAILSFASVFLHDVAHVGVAGIAATLCAVQVGAMAMRIWSGRHTDRRGNRRAWLRQCTMVAALMFVPLALCAAIGTSVPAPLTMVAVVLAGIAVSAWHGVAYTELATQAGAERAGTALGLANTLVFVAYFVAPSAIPQLLDRSGWTGVWLVAGACAAMAWPLFPRAGKDTGSLSP
ncbi:MFS transporter [Cupriavidus sp. H18C1]